MFMFTTGNSRGTRRWNAKGTHRGTSLSPSFDSHQILFCIVLCVLRCRLGLGQNGCEKSIAHVAASSVLPSLSDITCINVNFYSPNFMSVLVVPKGCFVPWGEFSSGGLKPLLRSESWYVCEYGELFINLNFLGLGGGQLGWRIQGALLVLRSESKAWGALLGPES